MVGAYFPFALAAGGNGLHRYVLMPLVRRGRSAHQVLVSRETSARQDALSVVGESPEQLIERPRAF